MERKRIAGSETAGVTARSTKRSAGTEAVRADGVESEAEARKREDATAPTCPPQYSERRLGVLIAEESNGGSPISSPLLISGRIFSSKFLNPKKGRESHDTKEVSKCQQSAYVRTG